MGIKVTYGPIGSGGGITQITNRTVDFGASDAPLTPDQSTACKGCVQIPWALSATSIPYRLDNGPNRIRLSGPVLANIFLGKIKTWDEPAIKALNKGKSIPNTADHRHSPQRRLGDDVQHHRLPQQGQREWKIGSRSGHGRQLAHRCRRPRLIGGFGALSQTNGGITYVDVAFSLANHFKFASVKNKAGVYALPGLTGIKAAAATIRRVAPDNGGISIVNPAK